MSTFTVTTNNDSGAGSLREAIGLANATPDSTINFSITGQILLLTALPDITASVSIEGPGSASLEIRRDDSAADFGILTIAAAANIVSISGLTISNGHSFRGAGIFVGEAAVLNLNEVVVRDNAATNNGGGIFVDIFASLNINNSIIRNNTCTSDDDTVGSGGGIAGFDDSIININTTEILENTANTLGGGIATNSILNATNSNISRNATLIADIVGAGAGITVASDANIDNCIIDGNNSASDSGGIATASTISNITNSRITNNTAAGDGAGLVCFGTTNISYCTISSNTSGGFGGGIGTSIGAIINIKYSTINDNSGAEEFGGDGLDIFTDNVVNVSNSTFTNNPPGDEAKNSIYNFGGDLTLINVTVHNTDNTETVVNELGEAATTLRYGNSIIDSVVNIDGEANDLGGNFISENDGDPQLGPLQDNGGPTLTMAPLVDSPLINNGLLELVDSETDQRNFIRVIDGSVDIGAVEFGSRIICYSGDSLVLARNRITKKVGEVKARDIIAGVHYVYDIKREKFVAVKHNIVTGPTTRYMKIAKNLLGENQPVVDFFVTAGHKLVVDDKIVKAKNIPGALRVKVEPEPVYSICTENKTVIMVNGLKVLAWGLQEWLDYSKKNSINWYDNHLDSNSVRHE